MESTRTISELKSSFIRAQVRILSEGLEPAEDWRNYAAETEEDDLSDKVVGDVLQKCKCKHPELSLQLLPACNFSTSLLTLYRGQ